MILKLAPTKKKSTTKIIEKTIMKASEGIIITSIPTIPTIATDTVIIIVSNKNITWQASFEHFPPAMQVFTINDIKE